MRPDEHKKKRSAQYQKKRGGGSQAGKKTGADKGGSTSTRLPVDVAAKTSKCAAAHVSTSESEQEEAGSTHKNFRRRTIASNWAKYDILPAKQEGGAAKGQDFNKLRQAAASAVAHFRFKDEESWEAEGDNPSTSASEILSFDCSKLADNLDCLPVYTLLRLESDIFSSEQLDSMDHTANKHRSQLGLPPVHHADEETQPQASEDSPPRVQPGSSLLSALPASPVSADHHSAVRASDNSCSASAGTAIGASRGPSGQETGAVGAGFPHANLDALWGEECSAEELDGKLALAAPPTGELTHTHPQQSPPMLCTSNSACTPNPTVAVAELDPSQESVELEDWLDSVLDS